MGATELLGQVRAVALIGSILNARSYHWLNCHFKTSGLLRDTPEVANNNVRCMADSVEPAPLLC